MIREQTSYNKLLDYVEGETVLDIGGNIGAFAYFAKERGAKKVVSFEPEPSNIKMYESQNLDTILVKAAVAENDGVANFYVNNEKNKGLHSLRKTRGRDCIEVKTVSFEKVLKKVNPTALKIDIEGGEYYIDFSLIPKTVKRIAVELHLTTKEQRDSGRKLLKFLKSNFDELSNAKVGEKNWTITFIGVRKWGLQSSTERMNMKQWKP